jgi:hypothetical protein
LRVLPSQVEGVFVDSAFWNVRTESPEMSTQTTLYYFAQLHSDRPAPLDSMAVAFHSTAPADDSLLLVGGWRVPKPTRGGGSFTFGRDYLRPGEPRMAMRALSVSGSRSGAWSCPVSVQLVRIQRGPGW